MPEENMKQFKDDICRHFDTKTAETKQQMDTLGKHFDAKAEETKRHFDVVGEALRGEIQQVAEGVSLNTEKLEGVSEQVAKNTEKLETISGQVAVNTEKLTEHDQKFDKINNTLEIVKTNVGLIKNELIQKVPREEFVVLEKRVSMVEAKIS